jgi:hypothetical protein
MVKKKLSRLISVSKSPKQSCYTLQKDDTLQQNLYDFFIDLGMKEDNFYLQHFLVTESWDMDKSGKRFMKIDAYHDYRYNLQDKKWDIDVFIGREKVILVVRSKSDRQKEVSEKLFKYVKFRKE